MIFYWTLMILCIKCIIRWIPASQMVKWCFVLRKDIKKAATKFVTACYSSWTSQGLNLGPPDYESVALTN